MRYFAGNHAGLGQILGVRCCHSLELGQDRHFLKVLGAEARPVDTRRRPRRRNDLCGAEHVWFKLKIAEDLQFFATCFTKVAQRIDMLFNPGVPHLLQGHIGREICIHYDPSDRVRALNYEPTN